MTNHNVLFFCVDEMRADHLACMGNSLVQTPNLDRLAARGTLFRRSYCNNPICMPARMSMFTGLLPRDHGLRINGQTAHPGLPLLPDIFRRHGYRTHAAGKLHLTPWTVDPERQSMADAPEAIAHWYAEPERPFPLPYHGFESFDFVGGHTAWIYGPYLSWLRQHGGDPATLRPQAEDAGKGAFTMAVPEELHYNRYIADRTIQVIEESAAKDAPPFFCWCSFPDPHCPVGAPRKYMDLYEADKMPLPARRENEVDDLPPVYQRVLAGELRPNGVDNNGISDRHWQEIIAGTYAMITHLDCEVGRVLDALERTGQIDNTLIVFISDHGDMMGDHGLLWKSFYTFRGCIQIPTIIAAPGGVAGQTSDKLISQIDLLPSVLEVCGLELPGADWINLATDFERGSIRPLHLYPGRSWRSIVEGKDDAIRSNVVIENDDPTMGFRVRSLVTPRYRLSVYPGLPDGELFDLQEDPDELQNLWYRPDAVALRNELQAELLAAYSSETPLFPIPLGNA